MKLHEIDTKGKKTQRVGRGGKRGTTSGRGQKGQKSRSGRRIRPAYRDLIQRLPKRRGFKNKTKSPHMFVLNLADLENIKLKLESKKFNLDKEVLKEVGILPLRYNGVVKLLGTGEITFPLNLKGITISKSVKEKIEKAGGKVE